MCSPMWQYTDTLAPISGFPVLSGSTLYVDTLAIEGTAHNPTLVGALVAFDANGVTNCSGSPKACSPLWQSAGNTYAAQVAPAVSAGAVFVPTFLGPLAAFGATGSTNCSGTPTTCAPMWTSDVSAGSGDWDAPPVIGSSVVYAVSPGGQGLCVGRPGNRRLHRLGLHSTVVLGLFRLGCDDRERASLCRGVERFER